MAHEDRNTELVLELAEEFLDRYRKGERPPLREYTERHPELASEIREVFPAMAMMEKIAVADESLDESAREGTSEPALKQLGDYRIIREIGHGGMGVVYEAEQISLGRYVALKVLPHKALANEKTKKRFEREAKAAAKLHHTNIVPVFGFGEYDGLPYYAMQFIQGLSLDLVLEELKRLKNRGGNMSQVASLPMTGPPTITRKDITVAAMARSMLTGEYHADSEPSSQGDKTRETSVAPSPADASFSAELSSSSHTSSSIALPGQDGTAHTPPGTRRTYWHSVAQTGVQVAEALEYAHKQGVIHRDIKPSNLLLDTSGTVWVTDFGLAKFDDRQDITNAGDLLGTLRYMPPEAFDGKADGRGDIYSLGLTLYELLAFRPAFDERERNRLVKKVTTTEPARLDRVNPEVPRDLVTIVHKAMAREPTHRYQTPAEMADDLNRFGEDRPVQARRVSDVERLWRWCRRNPLPASLLAGIVVTFLAGFAGVIWQWREAETAREHEQGQRSRVEGLKTNAESARDQANEARAAAEKSKAAAEAETYRAVLGEVRALRAGHEPGWRDKALREIACLAAMPTPRRDLFELRSEAAATLATPDIYPFAKVELPTDDLGSFAFSPDGRTLLTAGFQRGLDFWDIPTQAHQSFVDGLTVSQTGFDKVIYFPDGREIAIGTRDKGVIFTDRHGVPTNRAPIVQGTSQPTKLAIDAKGERIAVAWTGGPGVTVHDVASGEVLEKFSSSAAPFALSPDGRWLARTENSDVVLLPIAAPQPPIAFGRSGGAFALAFSPDGSMLAAACFDHTTVIWDVAKREQIMTLRGHRERVFDVAFSPDGEWIATAGLDYTARIWEARTGQLFATLPAAPVRRVKWSPTGEYLALSTNHSARDVYLYKITGRNRIQHRLTGHSVELRSVVAHPRLDRFTTSGYHELMSWDLSTPRPTPIALPPHPGAATCITYSSDGALLAATSWSQNTPPTINIRDGQTGKIRETFPWPGIIWSMAFDSVGEFLACGDLGGTIAVWDIAKREVIKKFATGATVRSIAILDRPRVVVANGKSTIFLFDRDSDKPPRTAEVSGGEIQSLAFDPSGSRLFVGLRDGAIASYSLPDLRPGARLENAHSGSIWELAVSPDGRLIASLGTDHRVIVRDTKTLDALVGFPPWPEELRSVAFDAKSRRLAIVGTSSDVELWDLAVLRTELEPLGLSWDSPATNAAPIQGVAQPVAMPVIRSGAGRNPTP